MAETWGVPGERVIAEGTEGRDQQAGDLGEPDFAIDTYLDVQEETRPSGRRAMDRHPPRWHLSH